MSNKTKTVGWNYETDEMLIELVRLKSQLYDHKSPYYNDTIAKRTAWQEIATYMNKQASACKERWESLRGQHRKNLNKQRHSGGHLLTKWRYDEQMSFLKEFMKDKTQLTGEADTQAEESELKQDVGTDDDNHPEDPMEPEVKVLMDKEIPSIQKLFEKRQKTHLMKIPKQKTSTLTEFIRQKRNRETTMDPMDTFFSLMATTVKRFSPADQHFIKSQVFSLVSKIEEKYILHDQNLTGYQNCHLSFSSSPAAIHSLSPPPSSNVTELHDH